MTVSEPTDPDCKFCKIVRKETEAYIVLEDKISMAFLDHRPLFPGHCLLVPKSHYRDPAGFPSGADRRFFLNVQALTAAVEDALRAEGSFVAINNRISQSVPHLHVHIVPRRKGDGLKGFFWPRRPYRDLAEMRQTQAAIRLAVNQNRP